MLSRLHPLRVHAVVTVPAAVLLGVAAGLLGGTVHAAGVAVLGVTLPAGLALALVTEVMALRLAASAVGTRLGSGLAAGGWAAGVLVLATPRPEGDLLVAADGWGYALLVLGTLAAAVGVALPAPPPEGHAAARSGSLAAAPTGREPWVGADSRR